ncbi:DUF676-domain-containing protein [Xylariaceae sp. FL0804]|nr:DUF676-domain-containing protein [Xylariaceae sp. FL0804]
MLLLQQVGSVKIGEVVRYTVTYTPSRDRILPSPDVLHLRVRNTSPLPLRAAFVHGPYTLNVSAYPSHYDPNTKFENPRRYGVPEFEPMLKAAGTWSCQLIVPDNIKESAGMGAARGDFGHAASDGAEQTDASWIIEIASQVIFSSSAAVGYEILLARDEKSLDLSSTPAIKGQAHVPQPGRVRDFQQSKGAQDGHHPAQLKGVFSKAVTVAVEDTASLWNTPQLPGWDDWDHDRPKPSGEDAATHSVTKPPDPPEGRAKDQKPKRVHLVVLTHGLHSNLGADMLYLKESIDNTVKQAKIDARARRARDKFERDAERSGHPTEETEDSSKQSREMTAEDEVDSDDEEVIVRGFSGNATRTERGIKFLGKRLARYVLSMTYPDQPVLPNMKKAAETITHVMRADEGKGDGSGRPTHKHSTVHKALHPHTDEDDRKFRITSISFIGHSLGGLIQTYAIAYIQKHSPDFFNLIRPINFIGLASPLLGLSNENPLYVKFALDFGLVGRTGQDLGLTWRAPTIARSGWGALVGTLGENAHKKVMGEPQAESKPLLRILPTGPAHTALKKFRNRTLYSNVVNDGIVPLRTSCLLFLDWQGLGRVEKARREAGLVETFMGFGWAELTGANTSQLRKGAWTPDTEEPPSRRADSPTDETTSGDSREVPQPSSNAVEEDDRRSLNIASSPQQESAPTQNSHTDNDHPLSGILNFFKGNGSPKLGSQKTSPRAPKEHRIYQRSQTLKVDEATPDSASSSRSRVSSGQELEVDQDGELSAPPRTTFFESAGDLLNPKLPSVEYLLDPTKRPRTIFHDRIYHPSDIPPPPLKKRPTGTLAIRRRTSNLSSSSSSGKRGADGKDPPLPSNSQKTGVSHEDSSLSTRDYDDPFHTDPDRDPGEIIDSSSMRVEEKIARAYHRGLSWRKVLVKMEPDAHNNIIVRRMFANAFGWPVVKHLVDAHFSDAAAARMEDNIEQNGERAKALNKPPDETGGETGTQEDAQPWKSPNTSEGPGDRGDDHHAETVPLDNRPFNLTIHGRTDSEAREAADAVPDLPTAGSKKSLASHSSKESPPHQAQPQPRLERADSSTWSDSYFADSGDESSDMDMDMAYGGRHHHHHPRSSRPPQEEDTKGQQGSGGGSGGSPVWNWTEKIVGKGAAAAAAAAAGGKKKSGGSGPKENPDGPLSPVDTTATRPSSGHGAS